MKALLSLIKISLPLWCYNRIGSIQIYQWIFIAISLFISVLAFLFFNFLIKRYLQKFIRSSKIKNSPAFGLIAFSLIWRMIGRDIDMMGVDVDLAVELASLSLSISVIWSMLIAVDYTSQYFIESRKLGKFEFFDSDFEEVLIPMVSKGLKVFILGVGAIFIAKSLSYDIAGILAGLGIGGVAVAFAAKDTIANLFGSATVIIDRPFRIGDFVNIEKQAEGVVEGVGFRSTKIKTNKGSIVTIPNSLLANSSIENLGSAYANRYTFNWYFNVENNSLEKIREFIAEVNLKYKINDKPAMFLNEIKFDNFVITFNFHLIEVSPVHKENILFDLLLMSRRYNLKLSQENQRGMV